LRKSIPAAFQSATAHPQARISADGEGRRRYLVAALFFCPRSAESLSFAALRPGFFRHSGGSSSSSIGGIPLSSAFQNPQGFGAISPATPFPEVLLRTQNRDLFRHCYIDELVESYTFHFSSLAQLFQ
jgi:hypothetical protein